MFELTRACSIALAYGDYKQHVRICISKKPAGELTSTILLLYVAICAILIPRRTLRVRRCVNPIACRNLRLTENIKCLKQCQCKYTFRTSRARTD